MKMTEEKIKTVRSALLKNKYVLAVLLLGLVLILLPTGGGSNASLAAVTDAQPRAPEAPVFSLAEQEERLESTLSCVAGAGKVKVLLSLRSTVSRELAESGEGVLIISAGSAGESPVELYYSYPAYLGAVILCEGADNPAVSLGITQAVSAFTGLGANRIEIMKMK